MKKYFWYALPVVFLFLATLTFFYFRDQHKLAIVPINPQKEEPGHKFFAFDQWKLFKEESPEEFQIMFPTLPVNASEQILDPSTKEMRNYRMFVSEGPNGKVFMLTIVTYPEGSTTLQEGKVIPKLLAEMVKTNPSHKVLSTDTTPFLGIQSMETTFKGDTLTWDSRAFIKGKSLFVLTAIFKNEQYNHSEFEYFKNSFEFDGKDK